MSFPKSGAESELTKLIGSDKVTFSGNLSNVKVGGEAEAEPIPVCTSL